VNPSVYGQSVTFTATVNPVAPGAGLAPVTVTFKDGATVLGTGTLNASGQATFSTSALSVSSHSITAEYGGDGNFNAQHVFGSEPDRQQSRYHHLGEFFGESFRLWSVGDLHRYG
jgi:hypothetical protein